MQTILGATGPIGSFLAEELNKKNIQLRLVSRNPKKFNPENELVSANLLNKDEAGKAIEGSGLVYLAVGLEYKTPVWKEQWPKLMENVVEACKKHNSKLIFFDNMYMYGRNYIGSMTEDTPVNPSSEKGKVRAHVNEMIFSEVEKGNLQATIARAPDFISDKNSVFYEMVIKAYMQGKTARWFMDLDKIHSFIYDVDAAKGTAILGTSPQAFDRKVWHLPCPREKLTIRDWINITAKKLGKEPKVSVMSSGMISFMGLFMSILKEFKEMSYQYDRDYFFDSSLFINTFNYKPASPEEMISNIINRTQLISKG